MANRRVSLTDLAGKTALDAAQPESDEARASMSPANGTPEVPSAQLATAQCPPQCRVSGGQAKAPAPGEWVRYDQYERKEARLRSDQYGRLSDASRNLNRARNGAGERITENTLIRVAVDLLLARETDLVGTTEVEIRRALGL